MVKRRIFNEEHGDLAIYVDEELGGLGLDDRAWK